MQIVIPMSGEGRRFQNAGYETPKPLIEVDGKPMIEHVVNLFPGESDITFICSSKHLKETKMREVLNRIAPKGKIVSVAPHKKGPVHAVSKVFDLIHDDQEVIVNYCDFSVYWDYRGFLEHTRNRDADGAVPAYRGFHPHMKGPTNYAFMREKDQWMLEIKEKEPFTNDRMSEFASTGTYYFRSGKLLKNYFSLLMEKNLHLNGEFYASLAYNLLVEDGYKVSIYEVQHMLQWGTPEDLELYKSWSEYFEQVAAPKKGIQHPPGLYNLVMPMAGKGERFRKQGYDQSKPFIPVSGKPMAVQAASCLPKCERYYFICQEADMINNQARETLKSAFSARDMETNVLSINKITKGQASTAAIGVQETEDHTPIFIAPCDSLVSCDYPGFWKLLESEPDIVCFTFIKHEDAALSPHKYGWVDSKENIIQRIAIKEPISSNPREDEGISGFFYFKNKTVYSDCLDRLYESKNTVNGEFYIDSMLGAAKELNMKVMSFPVKSYISWGTPEELKTYNYWQSFFHKCSWHPYNLRQDPIAAPDSYGKLEDGFFNFSQRNE